MSLFNIFNVAGSAMSAQSQRLNVVASNIANADSTTSSTGETYKAKQVVFQAVPMAAPEAAGVRVQKVVEDASPPKMLYDPKHPQADEQGYVAMPNVNVGEELVNMIETQRAYEMNSKAIATADSMLQYISQTL